MRAVLVLIATASVMACGGIGEDGPDFGRMPPPLVFEHQSLSGAVAHDEPANTTLLAGASFALTARQPDLDVGIGAQNLAAGVLAIEGASSHCTCTAKRIRAIAIKEACEADEKRQCLAVIVGRTLRPGRAKIGVTNEKNFVTSTIEFEVASPTSIEGVVQAAPPIPEPPSSDITAAGAVGMTGAAPHIQVVAPGNDGVVELRRGQPILVAPIIRDVAGRELHFAAADDVKLSAQPDGVLLDGQRMAASYEGYARKEGVTAITITAAGLVGLVRLRVVP